MHDVAIRAQDLLDGYVPATDRPAVVEGRSTYSYSTLASLVEAFCAALEPFCRGKVVGLSLPNSVELVAAFLALRRLGASIVLMPTRLPEAVVARVHTCFWPQAYLVAGNPEPRLGQWTQKVPMLVSIAGPQRAVHCATGGRTDPAQAMYEEPVVVKVTSGSSGTPKAVTLRRRQLAAEAVNVVRSLRLTSNDVVMSGVSMVHSYGFDLGLIAPLAGGSSIAIAAPLSAATPDEIVARAATVFLGIPRIYEMFLARRRTGQNLGGVRYLLSCTAPLNVETITLVHEAFGAVICQHYGTSETGALATHVPSNVLRRPRSVGQSVEGVTLSIVDGEGRPARGPGLVFAMSEVIGDGYVHGMAPAAGTGVGFTRGGFLSGDRGWFDDDGFLYLEPRASATGRKAALLTSQAGGVT